VRSRAKATNQSNAAAFASASRLTTFSGSWPMRSFFTGTSRILPVRVRGISLTTWTSSGTCRGEQSERIRLRSSPMSSSVSDAPSASTMNSGIQASPVPSIGGTSTTIASAISSSDSTAA